MFRSSVTSRYGTGIMVALAACCAAPYATAGIAANATADPGKASPGTYTLDDSKALLYVLEAPEQSSAADAIFENEPEFARDALTSFRNVPQSASTLSLEPESKRFEAWDIKGGTIVPEPATALLMGAGLAALAVFRGLRRRAGIE